MLLAMTLDHYLAVCRPLRSLQQPTAAMRGLPSRVSSISTISRAKIQTGKMTFVIVLAYIACWAPFFSVHMWSVWDKNAPDEDSTDVAFTISMLLGSLSSCCNPWVYMGFNSRLRPRPLRHLACCGGPRPQPHVHGLNPQDNIFKLCQPATSHGEMDFADVIKIKDWGLSSFLSVGPCLQEPERW
uniref:Vasopressin V1b receptor n=1 Tax=Ursus americanus TaxID=9643 RepID=A0A452QKS2_URSAM